MKPDPELQALLAPMIDREVELGGPFQVDRERVLARMAHAHQVDTRARRGWYGYAALAAAGVLVVVLGFRFVQSAGTSLQVEILQGAATQAQGELTTAANSRARVSTPEGEQLELRSETRLALGELQASEHRVKLVAGAIRCTIPHRSAEHAFRVVTPHVTVVDLGTIFTVRIEGASTYVSVEEGEVMVQRGADSIRVQAPNSWSSAPLVDPAPVPPVEPTRAVDPAPAPSPPVTATGLSPRVTGGKVTPPATLGKEAQLLRAGLAAERQGRSAEAANALRTLIAKYPSSPLVPDARAALARVEASAH